MRIARPSHAALRRHAAGVLSCASIECRCRAGETNGARTEYLSPAGELNADGVLDLVVAHAGGLATLLGNGSGGHGNGTFHVASNRAFGSGSVSELRLADLDMSGTTVRESP